ncbi:MAG TPA: metallophosphoesterase [Phycisphaerae bacterium]|nr:metallophosphoesterase [Phycisphaerae bacterium]HRR85668.1 metallophosphoesterase [Phycisphaerae bacterium]
MSERHGHLLEAILLAAIGLILAYFLGVRLGWLPVFWGATFLLIAVMLLLANLFWWAWVDRQLQGRGRRTGSTTRRRLLRSGWAAFMTLMLSPLLLVFVGLRGFWDAYPFVLIALIMVWHLLMVLLVTVWAPLAGFWAMFRRVRARVAGSHSFEKPVDPSRRQLLLGAVGVAPVIVAGGSLGLAVWQGGRFKVRRVSLRMPRLPDRLRGLTITHISDLHVGRLFRPEHLPRLIDAVNQLKSDLIAVTGDLVDHSVDFMPLTCDALAQMESRCGRFIVVGNHDLIDSPEKAVQELHRREPFLLLDRMLPLLIDGETIQIAGLFWSRYDEPRGEDPGHTGRVTRTLAGADSDRFTIALAHHPHAFDPLADRGVDLTLAGHTHGGQLMLTPPGSHTPIGGGSLLFRYIWGEYRRGDCVLEVSAGVGNWFPVRINAPAEITHIRLI